MGSGVGGVCGSLVEHMASILKGLGSLPSTAKREERKTWGEGEEGTLIFCWTR